MMSPTPALPPSLTSFSFSLSLPFPLLSFEVLGGKRVEEGRKQFGSRFSHVDLSYIIMRCILNNGSKSRCEGKEGVVRDFLYSSAQWLLHLINGPPKKNLFHDPNSIHHVMHERASFRIYVRDTTYLSLIQVLVQVQSMYVQYSTRSKPISERGKEGFFLFLEGLWYDDT